MSIRIAIGRHHAEKCRAAGWLCFRFGDDMPHWAPTESGAARVLRGWADEDRANDRVEANA